MKLKQLLFSSIAIYSLVGCKNDLSSQVKDTEPEPQEITLKKSKLFKDYSDEKNRVADFVEEYLNIMHDSTLETRNFYWQSKILTVQQDKFLHGGLEKGFLLAYPPKILGIRDLGNRKYLAKISFEQDDFLFKIMTLKVGFDGLNRPYFIDLFSENLEDYDKIDAGKITFYYSQKTTKSESLEQKMVNFNQKTADLFQITPKRVTLIACKDLSDYCNLLGYDYMPYLNYDTQTGGIALPEENILLCANNSPYYPHELVHLYVADLNAHSWFDEGAATYLGGSVDYSLKHHLKKLANLADSLDFSKIPTDKKLDDDTNFKYTIGGLFCKLAYEKYGKVGFLKLLTYGRTEEDFHKALKETFGLEKEEYNNFIKTELKKIITESK